MADAAANETEPNEKNDNEESRAHPPDGWVHSLWTINQQLSAWLLHKEDMTISIWMRL